MAKICREYQQVVRMLMARGTPDFHLYVAELYGSAHDVFHAGDPTLANLGTMMESTLDGLVSHELLSEDDAWVIAMRAFRGSCGDLKPFTKDLTYLKGFVLSFNYMRLAMATGKIRGLPLLFAGKLNIEDIPTYVDLLDAGVLKAPQYLPPYLQDLRGLAAWFSFSRFMAGLNFDQLEKDFHHLLR